MLHSASSAVNTSLFGPQTILSAHLMKCATPDAWSHLTYNVQGCVHLSDWRTFLAGSVATPVLVVYRVFQVEFRHFDNSVFGRRLNVSRLNQLEVHIDVKIFTFSVNKTGLRSELHAALWDEISRNISACLFQWSDGHDPRVSFRSSDMRCRLAVSLNRPLTGLGTSETKVKREALLS
jgi:hypothetical protein